MYINRLLESPSVEVGNRQIAFHSTSNQIAHHVWGTRMKKENPEIVIKEMSV